MSQREEKEGKKEFTEIEEKEKRHLRKVARLKNSVKEFQVFQQKKY